MSGFSLPTNFVENLEKLGRRVRPRDAEKKNFKGKSGHVHKDDEGCKSESIRKGILN